MRVGCSLLVVVGAGGGLFSRRGVLFVGEMVEPGCAPDAQVASLPRHLAGNLILDFVRSFLATPALPSYKLGERGSAAVRLLDFQNKINLPPRREKALPFCFLPDS